MPPTVESVCFGTKIGIGIIGVYFPRVASCATMFMGYQNRFIDRLDTVVLYEGPEQCFRAPKEETCSRIVCRVLQNTR